jgi:hypothetical protein
MMTTPATLLSLYLVVGLLLMTFAMASGAKRRRAATLDPLIDGTAPGAAALFFIALLWPIWLVVAFAKKNGRDENSNR